MRKFARVLVGISLCASLLLSAAGVFAEEQVNREAVQTDAQAAEELGLMIGEGDGVTPAYLAQKSTRIQAALISLRLQGKLEEALSYKGTVNFTDAKLVGKGNQAVLAYLKDHPEYGWTGTGGGRFDPLSDISAAQLYKVLLEVAGYKSGTDFAYANTETYAAGKGLGQIAGAAVLTNAHIATALIEALTIETAHGHALFAMLQESGAIPASAMMPQGERIGLRSDAKLGTYMTDGKGRSLYFFTKDAQDVNACQGECITNWPLFASEQLQIPASLDPADFTVLTRKDGTKQWMYKGWPLYYFVKDKAAGDVLGEAVGGVWFLAKSDYSVMLGTNGTLGNYLTDDRGRTLYYFDKDTPQSSVCQGDCIANWPAYGETDGSVPSTMKKADFNRITRADGSIQATFKGYPLYYFIKDKAHGDVTGQDVNKVWFVIDPAKFNGTTAAQAVKTYRVDIKEFSFGTEPLTVEAGSEIVFTNYDDMKHNAVAVDGAFATPLLAKGESFTIKIDKAGTYDYFCEPHKSFMTGQIIVK
ncbi:plastocyanin/azurin family copper-binding protein [Paenibacillus mendelii]|uniref:Plastocyanin/azurin family copper-binding protein n=1 Tax=Paenibacillus mendelii TaxID=206163 RepID=A0ABV6J8D6_9BACL|nr:plastocyanin/azurin family copper-binding protein [Paenibacillus mendelii]MCQ6559488.1 plastocyanin/azurin family copper-binding protein [Paenibacillus mendelii]